MPDATLKDALYALSQANGRLIRRPAARPGGKPSWTLEPGGLLVPPKVVNAIQRYPLTLVADRADGVYYRWRD